MMLTFFREHPIMKFCGRQSRVEIFLLVILGTLLIMVVKKIDERPRLLEPASLSLIPIKGDMSTERPAVRILNGKNCNHCNEFRHSFIINPMILCSGSPPKILIAITSVPSNSKARRMIRLTWFSHCKQNSNFARCLFLMGSGYSAAEQEIINKESAEYGDILQGNFIDARGNQTLKVNMAMLWSLQYCSQAKFFLRAEDDSYINIPEVVFLINNNFYHLHRNMSGHIVSYDPIALYKIPQWYKQYTSSMNFDYPSFCNGKTFLLGNDLMLKIMSKAPDVPFFPVDTVFYGLVLEQLGMSSSLVQLEGFAVQWSTLQVDKTIQWYTVQGVGPAETEEIWERERGRIQQYTNKVGVKSTRTTTLVQMTRPPTTRPLHLQKLTIPRKN